jgi:hypothetical protein
VAEPPQFREPMMWSARSLRHRLIALNLPCSVMRRQLAAALKFQIPDYNDGWLARQLD